MTKIEDKLKELDIQLPEPSPPAANYVPYVISGNTLYVSGQIPVKNGGLPYTGKIGDTRSMDDGIEAAKLCGLNIISQVKHACDGNLDRVVRCVKLGGFVSCTPDFTDQPKVINGASDLMMAVFGDKGKHARFAVGAPSLPLDVTVEIDAVFEIK